MNRNLGLAGLFLVCAIMNMVNVFTTGSGFGLVLGGLWLVGSFMMYSRYRKEKMEESQDHETESPEAAE